MAWHCPLPIGHDSIKPRFGHNPQPTERNCTKPPAAYATRGAPAERPAMLCSALQLCAYLCNNRHSFQATQQNTIDVLKQTAVQAGHKMEVIHPDVHTIQGKAERFRTSTPPPQTRPSCAAGSSSSMTHVSAPTAAAAAVSGVAAATVLLCGG